MQQTFRKGSIGAILDEYEVALADLKKTIRKISDTDLVKIVDAKTRNPNCKSVQTILTHIVKCGYFYPILILRNKFPGKEFALPTISHLKSIKEYNNALDEMFFYNEQSLGKLKESDMWNYAKGRMDSGWGQIFDYDQIMEHAIMHIYRHRRQIQKFIIKLEEWN